MDYFNTKDDQKPLLLPTFLRERVGVPHGLGNSGVDKMTTQYSR